MVLHEHHGWVVPLPAEILGTGIELTPISLFFVIIVFVVLIRLKDLVSYIRNDRGED
ncbi:hypothetical protein [Haloglomus litoreum]|uniref:hypothetical protein n=1 Tax=Haloglomus litoreum TaxID=3034026 RepID=UPI0023E84771|nr:hypothetical protein [Haloglomus sp. DT116]